MKRPLLIAKHDVALSKHHEHIGMMIMPPIDELQRHWHKIGIVAIELRPEVHPRMHRITSWKLHDLDVAMQVQCNEVTRHVRGFMAHKGIDLVSAWPSIMQIIPGDGGPRESKWPSTTSIRASSIPMPT